MKKKVLGLALVAMSLAAFNGSAQNTTTADNTVCKENRICTKNADCKNQVSCIKGERQARMAKADPYAGLTLTDSQKAKLEQLDNKCRTARKEQAQARQEKKLKNDAASNTAATRRIWVIRAMTKKPVRCAEERMTQKASAASVATRA